MSVAPLWKDVYKPRALHPYLDSPQLQETVKTLSREVRDTVNTILASRERVGYTTEESIQQHVASLVFHDQHRAQTAQTLRRIAADRAGNPSAFAKPATAEEASRILALVAAEESLPSDDDANYA
ncbi:hypothetical protein HKX48_004219 [Thoreauomyces humboldtii]|nr:hypothetical protein HKX48_004219 [Thoreauomyces humboldtii]